MNKGYRHGVGAMILNHDNRIFVARRMDYSSGLQMPQGGSEKHESLEATLYRELEEEIGTDKFQIIYKLNFPLYYDFPLELGYKIYKGKYFGQAIHWFLLRFLGNDHDININTKHQEFSEWEWSHHTKLVDSVVDFKKTMYCIVRGLFLAHI